MRKQCKQQVVNAANDIMSFTIQKATYEKPNKVLPHGIQNHVV